MSYEGMMATGMLALRKWVAFGVRSAYHTLMRKFTLKRAYGETVMTP